MKEDWLTQGGCVEDCVLIDETRPGRVDLPDTDSDRADIHG
jgi:hypothetical protein